MDISRAEQLITDLSFPETIWKKPCLIGVFGFPGAGKTAVTTYLGNKQPLVVLTTDIIRMKYGFASGPETIETIQWVARRLLEQHYSVIIDGIHMMRRNRDEIRQSGAAQGAEVRFVHVVAPPEIIRQRLNERALRPEQTAQEGKFVITEEHFQRIIGYFEDPSDEPDVINVDTSPGATAIETQLLLLFGEFSQWLNVSS